VSTKFVNSFMANKLKFEKKVAVVSMLAEGSSIRAIERITGVNQNTIMSLGYRVGTACRKLADEKMRDLLNESLATYSVFALFSNHKPADKIFWFALGRGLGGSGSLRFSSRGSVAA
jgi:hypothetical protein